MAIEAPQKSIVLLGFLIAHLINSTFLLSNMHRNTMSETKTTNRSKLTIDDESRLHYIVNNSGCKIVDMNPFSWPVEKYSASPIPQKCNEEVLFKLNGQILRLNTTKAKDWQTNENVSCCFQDITRVEQSPDDYNETADWEINFSQTCHPIPVQKGSMIINSSYIRITCKGIEKNKVFTELHGTVLPPKMHSNEARKKAEYWDKRAKNGLKNPPSILVTGIDSVSRLHMIRKMPQTRKFLLSNDFIELNGYTRMGGYTFVNIMGGFAGLELNKYKSCWANQTAKLDDCPYIWKKFNKLNYMSAYIEDSPGVSIFHTTRNGFVHAPTDYYPMTVLTAAHLRNGFDRKSGVPSCVGGYTPEAFHVKFIRDFVVTMGKAYPYFLFSWLTSISHSNFNRLQSADDLFELLLTSVTNDALADPDNTIIIFMSDHGIKYGDFRESFLGFYEENLPIVFIRLPKSLKSRHPECYLNLKRNSGRLTSPYDLHSTFLHVEKLASDLVSTQNISTSGDLSTSSSFQPQYRERYSFFEYIPENRTCESAVIADKFCMCGVTLEVEASEFYSNYFQFIVNHINSLLQPKIDSGDCVILQFSKFLYGRQESRGKMEDSVSEGLVNYSDHLLAIETSPSKAHFECRLRIWQNGSSTILGNIDSINKYQGQSDCISDAKLRPLCLCKSAAQN